MPDPALEQSYREALASCPSGVVILHTLEMRHSTFVDEDGNPTAIRVVRDHAHRGGNIGLTARLEPSAPVNAGEMVDFVSIAFDLDLPEVSTTATPEMVLTMDNVGRELMIHLEAANTSQEKIEVTYRPFLSTDLEGPQMDPPMTMTLVHVEVTPTRVQGRARMIDIGNRQFPAKTYTAKAFPGLAR